MCSHESITWAVVGNTVADRIIDDSLMHKFRSSRRIRRSTKMLNAELKKLCGMKDYKHYVELKTNVLRNVVNDTDTSDSSNLSDTDYNTIYSSPMKRAKYVTENLNTHIFTSEDEREEYRVSVRSKKKCKSTKKRVQTRKSSQVEHPAESKKCVDTGWQDIANSNVNIPYNLRKRSVSVLNNEGGILESNNNHEARSSEQAFPSRLDSQSSTASTVMESKNKYMRRNHRDSDTMDSELSAEDSTLSNKTKYERKRKIGNNKNQGASINESNTEFNSRSSHYRSSLSRSIVEDSNESDNELNSPIKSKDNSSKLTAVIGRSTKNHDNTCVSHKPELLKNVRRNLIPALEKANSTNTDKDIRTDKNIESKLNYDPAVAIVNRHSTPLKKTRAKRKDPSPGASSLDQQKDSGIDEDSQDKFVKTKKSNNILTSENIEENATEKTPISSQQLKKIDEVIETAEDCKEDMKDAHSKFNDGILGTEISEEMEPSGGEMKNSSQLNQNDKKVETNREDKEDEHFAKTEYSNDIENQQLLSSKEYLIKDICPNEEKEEKLKENLSEVNRVDKDVSMHLINQERKTCVELEATLNIQKHLSPKITCTEVLNKRYKIIDKKGVKSITEKIDNIDNNIDAANECAFLNKNTLIHCPDAINNRQETVMNEEIDASMILETDNEEDNVNYMSPQTRKRLQQQAKLNLVVNSDSSESNDECVTTKSSRKRDFQLRVSESARDTCNNEDSINQPRRQKQPSLLDKENMFTGSNQNEPIINTELEARHKSKHEQSTQASTKNSDAQLNISSQYRPRNLQELIEDQELLVETMPASFTLADLSEDEEAFILNVPNKVVQCNLQGQMLKLKDKSIKFNKSKYRIVSKEVGITSCIFATGKDRKPYKLVNIKNIGTITIQEKLSQDSRRPDVSNSYCTSSMSKPIKNNG